MLEQLFGSRTRTKLLKLFLADPQKAYYIRELTRIIDTQINSVRRELKNLEECGIVEVVPEEALKKEDSLPASKLLFTGAEDVVEKEEDKKKKTKKSAADRQAKKYFKIDTTFALYDEIRALFEKSPLLVQHKLVTNIKKLDGIRYAALCGFFVNDDTAPIDIFIIGDVTGSQLTVAIKNIEEELGRELNFTTMPESEYKMRKNVTDKFLFTILEGKKKEIINSLF